MSSGTNSNPGAARNLVYGLPDTGKEMQASSTNIANRGMTPRQAELNRLWTHFKCAQYMGRSTDWDGRPHMDHLEAEAVSSGQPIPPGFYDAGHSMQPLKLRRPSSPYHIVKVVVERFTGLLFSQRRHPDPEVADDDETEEWLEGFAKDTRLWAKMIQARNYGGAMGSVALGFKFVEGKPYVEVHDPRWCEPTFEDRGDPESPLQRLEIRYIFLETIRDRETGQQVEAEFWYRRTIDRMRDVVWPRTHVGDGEEPDWDNLTARHEVFHNFKFCPVVWIQNLPCQEDTDGDPDCLGVYELSSQVDALFSQANRGTVSNCDPTLAVTSDGEWEEVRKGSDNALIIEKGGSAAYLEITGAGPLAAMKLADRFRELALEVARCTLDTTGGGPAKTALEVDRNYSSMIEKADVLREQYGEGLLNLFRMVLKAARYVGQTKVVEDETAPGGQRITVGRVTLTNRKIENEAGEFVWAPRMLGTGEVIELTWPDYYEPTQDDVNKAVDAAGKAKQFGLISDEKAVRYIARYFSIENVREEVEKAKGAQDAMASAEALSFGAAQGGRERGF